MSEPHDIAPDEAFATLADNVLGYTDLQVELVDEQAGVRMWLAELSIDTPVELDVQVGPDGKVTLGIAPPIYPVETGISPVFHQLRFTAVGAKP